MNDCKGKSWRKFVQAILAQVFFMYMAWKTADISWAAFVCISAGIFSYADIKQKSIEGGKKDV